MDFFVIEMIIFFNSNDVKTSLVKLAVVVFKGKYNIGYQLLVCRL